MLTDDLSDFSALSEEPILSPVEWYADGVRLIDQRLLPQELSYLHYDKVGTLAEAITDMVVRGAPAIGITAAYGVVLAARDAYAGCQDNWREGVTDDLALLVASRPTAVNLQWAVDSMCRLFGSIVGDPEGPLLQAAIALHQADITANIEMGRLGAGLMMDKCQVLTHCNAGALATGGYGTALGVIRTAHRDGRIANVFVCETRPRLQGLRLSAWELQQDGIPVTVLSDSAACYLCHQQQVKWLIVGADRIAANGDVCNKIGTYAHALMARHHGVKTMVVAPLASFDLDARDGYDIPIEQRAAEELLYFAGHRIAPAKVAAWNPAFDVTPAVLIDYIVTEAGIVTAPDDKKISQLFQRR